MRDTNYGHVIIEKNGKQCTCGNNGCFEKYAAMSALKSKMADIRNVNNVTGKELYEIIKSPNEKEEQAINEFIEDLNIGLSNYINIFEPEAICIGGSFAYFEDILLNKLINEMHKNNLSFNGDIPEIVVAKMRK